MVVMDPRFKTPNTHASTNKPADLKQTSSIGHKPSIKRRLQAGKVAAIFSAHLILEGVIPKTKDFIFVAAQLSKFDQRILKKRRKKDKEN